MMGIRKSIWMALTLILSFNLYADDDALVRRVDSLCRNSVGHNADKKEFIDKDGKRCIRYWCSVSSGNIDDSGSIADSTQAPGTSGAQVSAFEEECIDIDAMLEERLAERQREREERARQDEEDRQRGRDARQRGDSDGDSDGGNRIDLGDYRIGDEIVIDGDVIIVGSGDYIRVCLDSSGRLKRKCKGKRVVGTDIDYVIGDSIDRGRGSSRNGSVTWMYNGRPYECTNGVSIEVCLRDRYGIIMSRTGDAYICSDCSVRYRGRTSGGWGSEWGAFLGGAAELAGAVLPPVMGYLGQKAWANAYLGSNEAWAGAAATGFEQCRMMQTHYVDATYGYISGNELPDREVLPPECNGYNLGGFAGFGNGMFGNGYGGWGNPWGAGGYTAGFMGGMYGPGLGYNPYFNASAGFGNPYGGLYGPGAGLYGNLNLNSLLGLPPNGLQFGAGLNTGFGAGYGGPGFGGGYGGFGGGYGGFGGGYYGGNGAMMCITYPCPGAGAGGYGNGGYGGPGYGGGYGFPGARLGGGVNIGIGGGYGGGYGNPYGYGGGYGNPYGGGYGNPYGGWNGQAGFPYGGSYWGNNSVNGNGFWAVQNSHMSNQAALQAGSYYQQAALGNQVGQAQMNYAGYAGGGGFGYGGGGYGGYNAGYSPYNMGVNLGIGFGANLGGGFGGGYYP